jgi:hypothetical protein
LDCWPGDVRGMILGVRKWVDYPCKRHPDHMVTGLCYTPFDSEIYGKNLLTGNCPECMCESWEQT